MSKPEVLWEIEVGSLSDTCPAIGRDGTIYFGTQNGELFAVTSMGEVKWKHRVSDEIRSSPAIGDNGTIHFGSRDRFLHAVSPEGKRLWRFKTGGWVDSSPAIANDGSVIVGSWDKKVYCLDVDGSPRWEFRTGGPVTSSPAIGQDGTIYIGSHDGKLYALDVDGSLKWAYPSGGPITSSPAINGDDCIYVTSVDGFLHAVRLDGEVKWKLKTGGITASSPVIDSDGIILLGVNHEVWAVTPAGGKKWSRALENLIAASVVVDSNGNTYSISRHGMLLVMGPNREWKWQVFLSAYGHASPVLSADGILYLPGKGSKYCAIRAEAGLAGSSWPKFRGDLRNTGRAPTPAARKPSVPDDGAATRSSSARQAAPRSRDGVLHLSGAAAHRAAVRHDGEVHGFCARPLWEVIAFHEPYDHSPSRSESPRAFPKPTDAPIGFGVRQPPGAFEPFKAVEDRRTPRRCRVFERPMRFMSSTRVQSWEVFPSREPSTLRMQNCVLVGPRPVGAGGRALPPYRVHDPDARPFLEVVAAHEPKGTSGGYVHSQKPQSHWGGRRAETIAVCSGLEWKTTSTFTAACIAKAYLSFAACG